MSTHPALLALEASLAAGSSTPCTWRADRDTYIQEQSQALRQAIIEPHPVRAIASAWAQQHCGATAQVVELVAVARAGENWLLFNQQTGEFSLACATGSNTQPLSLLGFASKDALAEWLG
jgi:hypothetical protein